MTLDPTTWLTAAAALAGVILLLLLLARALRATGLAPQGAGRRLAVQEALAIDSRRRLLILRCDGREMLVMTGDGPPAMLGWLEGPKP
jgi:flagellar protein FliO/FliZ